MKYPMLVCRDPAIELTPEDRAAMRAGVVAWVDEMEGRGILQPGGHELRPASYGRTVRVRGGEALISDGPFAETKEQIGGFDVLECASLDEAIEVAGKHPVARFGAIDVRPFWRSDPRCEAPTGRLALTAGWPTVGGQASPALSKGKP